MAVKNAGYDTLAKGGVESWRAMETQGIQKLKDYDDEITFWWNEDPPTSTIGVLRLNALLAVGRMPIGERMYKIALIPADIKDELQSLL